MIGSQDLLIALALGLLLFGAKKLPELARGLGDNLIRLESGQPPNPSLIVLKRLAKALGVPVAAWLE